MGGLLVAAAANSVHKWLTSPSFWLAVVLVGLANVCVLLLLELRKRGRTSDTTGGAAELKKEEPTSERHAAERRARELAHQNRELSEANQRLQRQLNGRPTAKGASRVLGIDIGRVALSIGVLELEPGKRTRLPHLPLPGHKEREQFRSPLDPRRGLFGEQVYREIKDAVVAALEHWPGPVDGIGIGMPGQVDVVEGVVDNPEAFPPSEPFVQNLGATLAQDARVRALLNRDSDAMGRFATESLLVDNDVRCASRRILSDRLEMPGWDNFACVFVGGGVGAGFVFNRQIYYGRRHCAGEVGHVTHHLSLDPEDRAVIRAQIRVDPDGADQDEVQVFDLIQMPAACECGMEGVHWEALTRGPALEDLAVGLNSESAERLASAFGFPNQRPAAKQITLVAKLALGGESVIAGVKESAIEGAMRDMSAEASCYFTAAEARERVQALARDAAFHPYLIAILDCYAHYFGVGIANLTNALNLDHIALGGGVMDALWPLPHFRRAVWRVRRRYTLERAFRNELLWHDIGARPGWAWEGAALLFWDPSYAAVRARGAAKTDPDEVPQHAALAT